MLRPQFTQYVKHEFERCGNLIQIGNRRRLARTHDDEIRWVATYFCDMRHLGSFHHTSPPW